MRGTFRLALHSCLPGILGGEYRLVDCAKLHGAD